MWSRDVMSPTSVPECWTIYHLKSSLCKCHLKDLRFRGSSGNAWAIMNLRERFSSFSVQVHLKKKKTF